MHGPFLMATFRRVVIAALIIISLSLPAPAHQPILQVGIVRPWHDDLEHRLHYLSTVLFEHVDMPVNYSFGVQPSTWRYNNSMLITYSPLNAYFDRLRAERLHLRVGVVHFGDYHCDANTTFYAAAAFVIRDRVCPQSGTMPAPTTQYIPPGWRDIPPFPVPRGARVPDASESATAREHAPSTPLIPVKVDDVDCSVMPASERTQLYSMCGMMTVFRRRALNVVQLFEEHQEHPVPAFAILQPSHFHERLDPFRYYGRLRASKFVLVVPHEEGDSTDTTQVYEALSMGALPVLVGGDSRWLSTLYGDGSQSELPSLSQCPLLAVPHWRRQLPEVMKTLMNLPRKDLDKWQANAVKWWAGVLETAALRCGVLINSLALA